MLKQNLGTLVHPSKPHHVAQSGLPRFVQGDFAENMNHGKTLAWFEYATRAHPRSHWIFKLDADVVVDWTKTIQWLQGAGEFQYLGALNTFEKCGGFSTCPPPGCHDMSGSCWVYMSGGFYGVTTRLAHVLATCQYYKTHFTGHEDMTFGRAVKMCAASSISVDVVDVPRNNSWCHSKEISATHVLNGSLPMSGRCN